MEEFQQQARLEAVKAASRVVSRYDDIGNLLVHAGWLARFILTGNQPETGTVETSHCKSTRSLSVDQSP